jgi:hypothetical protein
MQPRRYSYVGPPDIKHTARRDRLCLCVTSLADLLPWSVEFLSGHARGTFTVTFIIDTCEQLWLADRRSEHVACADGQDVLAAGEITFERHANIIHAAEVTNQSTGYCPEPASWSVVTQVLARLGISHPNYFTGAFIFRRCNKCGTTNLIKDHVFECAVCNSKLCLDWNYYRSA